MKYLKKFILILGIFISSALFSMDQDDLLSESAQSAEPALFFTNHAKARMVERSISESDIQSIIRTGQRFQDADNPESIIYRERSKKSAKQLALVTKPCTSGLLIITMYYADTWGNLPKKRR